MIQIGIFYLLPFMLIFIFFGRLGRDHDRKMGFPIFLSLVLFFGIQFMCRFLIMLFIFKFSSAANPKQVIVDHILLMNISSFTISAIATFLYYRSVKKRIRISELEKNNEIETLGEK